jgi:hypothetical protein
MNEYTSFLRDFASSNVDSLEEDHVHMLLGAARIIEELVIERNDARLMYCEAEAEVNMYNKVATTAAEIADNMGWQDVADLIRKENNR